MDQRGLLHTSTVPTQRSPHRNGSRSPLSSSPPPTVMNSVRNLTPLPANAVGGNSSAGVGMVTSMSSNSSATGMANATATGTITTSTGINTMTSSSAIPIGSSANVNSSGGGGGSSNHSNGSGPVASPVRSPDSNPRRWHRFPIPQTRRRRGPSDNDSAKPAVLVSGDVTFGDHTRLSVLSSLTELERMMSGLPAGAIPGTRRQRIARGVLFLVTMVVCVLTFVVVGVSSFNCTYFLKGRLCVRPGQELSFASTFTQWMVAVPARFEPFATPSLPSPGAAATAAVVVELPGKHSVRGEAKKREDEDDEDRLHEGRPLSPRAQSERLLRRDLRRQLQQAARAVQREAERRWFLSASSPTASVASTGKASTTETPLLFEGKVYKPYSVHQTGGGGGTDDDDNDGKRLAAASDGAGSRRPPPPSSSSNLSTSLEDRVHMPKVRIISFNNRVTPVSCASYASAVLSGIPMSWIGHDEREYTHVRRWRHYLPVVTQERLADDDVLVIVDSDSSWTGEDILPFLASFIQLSPRSQEELDVIAVRAWEDYGTLLAPIATANALGYANASDVPHGVRLLQMPPALFNSEMGCMRVDVVKGDDACHVEYDVLELLLDSVRNGEPLLMDRLKRSSRRRKEVPRAKGAQEAAAAHKSLAEHFDSLNRYSRTASGVTESAHHAAVITAAVAEISGGPLTRTDGGGSDDDTPRHNGGLLKTETTGGGRVTASGEGDRSATRPAFTTITASPSSSTTTTTTTTTKRFQMPSAEERQRRVARDARLRYASNLHGQINSARFLNTGALVVRVWALRLIVRALEAYQALHMKAVYRPRWTCDQSVIATMYVQGRIWEAEQGLLFASPEPAHTDPSLSSAETTQADGITTTKTSVRSVTRAPPHASVSSDRDPRYLLDLFGLPPGIMGLDLRHEFFFVTTFTQHNVHYASRRYLRHVRERCSGLMCRFRSSPTTTTTTINTVISGGVGGFFWNSTVGGRDRRKQRGAAGDDDEEGSLSHLKGSRGGENVYASHSFSTNVSDDGHSLRKLRRTRSGALITPTLLWPLPSVQDRIRGYSTNSEDAADATRPVLFHYAGDWKEKKYVEMRHFLQWYFAGRYDGAARATAMRVLSETEIEMWGELGKHYYPYLSMCGNLLSPQ